MYAEIVSIGEELLSGDSDIVDTNAIYITKVLRDLGIRVLYKTTVGDDEQRITDVLRLALSRTDLIITTGGLGPTVDDMTRQGVANAVGRKLEFRQELLDDIARKFVRFGTRMSDNNRVQAMMPEGAITIDNPVGTAPSFIVEDDLKAIVSLPGVPREMKYLMEQAVIPYLREKIGAGQGFIKTRVLRTAGIGESLVDEKVGDLEKLANPIVGLAAHAGQTDIRITARAVTEAQADALIAEVEADVRKRLGTFIYGVDKELLESAFVSALKQAGLRAAIVEAGTGGMLRKRIESQTDGAALLVSAESFESPDVLRAAYNTTIWPDGDYEELTERLAVDALSKPGAGLAIAILSDEAGTAICVTDGVEKRNRIYSYGGAAVGGPEWSSGWGMSIGWYLLTHHRMKP